MSEILILSILFFISGLWIWIRMFRRIKAIRTAVESIAEYKHQDVYIQNDDWTGIGRAVNDLSERIEIRFQDLDAHKSRLEATFLSMFDGVMILDRDGNIVLMNQSLRQLLEITEDAVGLKPMEIIRNQDIQDLADAVFSTIDGVQMREIMILHPQEKILMIHATPIKRGSDSDGVVLVFHDITSLRKLEQVRRDFVANVSHELRTPMTNIKGYSETLLDGALEDPRVAKEFVQIIKNDADRLTQLIDDLLQLARIESGKMEIVKSRQDVHAIIDQVIKELHLQAQQKKVIVENLMPAPVFAMIDGSAIQQVFYNLMDNAIKYNREGGRVTISARSDDNCVVISVVDTGLGIPEEDLPRIFERFYRVDKAHSRKVGGTGLGLSIVKHILQLHGGDVHVISLAGHGTTFEVYLPN